MDREKEAATVTSPYSSNLLQQPVEAPRTHAASQPPAHTRSVTHVVAQPQPQPMQYAPQPQVMYMPAPPAPARANALAGVLLGLLVILLGAVALVGGYYATAQASPSIREAGLAKGTAMREGFRAGRDRGIDVGRDQALENASTTTAMRASIARQKAYDGAYRRGERAGRNSYTAPRYTGGGFRGYSAPRYGGGARNNDVYAAFGQAQSIANLTGAPVDVEIY